MRWRKLLGREKSIKGRYEILAIREKEEENRRQKGKEEVIN